MLGKVFQNNCLHIDVGFVKTEDAGKDMPKVYKSIVHLSVTVLLEFVQITKELSIIV